MNCKALVLALQKEKQGRPLTGDEVEMLLTEGDWNDLCSADLCSFGNSSESRTRILNRMRELQPVAA